jgi:WD40 repeat protein
MPPPVRRWLGRLLLSSIFGMAAACSRGEIIPPAPAPSITAAPPAAATLTPSPEPTSAPPAASLVARLGQGILEGIAWSPDGANLAAASASGVYLYQGESLQPWAVLLEGSWASALAYDAGGTQLAIGQPDGAVRLWDVANGKVSRSLAGSASRVSSLAFSPDGSLLAIGRLDGTLWVWDVRQGQVLHRLQGHTDRISSVSFAAGPGGESWLASASRDQRVIVWNGQTGGILAVFALHTGGVTGLAFRPSAPGADQPALLASSSLDRTIRFWSVEQELLNLILNDAAGNRLRSLAFSSQGEWLASGDESGFIQLWDGRSGEPLRRFPAHPGSAILGLAYQPGTSNLASAGEDGVIRLWKALPAVNQDQPTPPLLATAEGFSGQVNGLAVRPAGDWLASAHADGSLRLWSLSSGSLLAALRGHAGPVTGAAFHPSRDQIVSAGNDGSLRLWEMQPVSRAWIETRTLLGHANIVWAAAFSPDGSRIATASADGTVRTWDAASGAVLQRIGEDSDWIYTLAYRPDGGLLAWGDAAGRINLWNPASDPGSRQAAAAPASQGVAVLRLAFTPDSGLLISAGKDGVVWLRDPASGEPRARFPSQHRQVTALAISADGAWLATGGPEGVIRIWELASRQMRLEIQVSAAVNSLEFASLPKPGEALLLSGGSDGTIQLWALSGLVYVEMNQ